MTDVADEALLKESQAFAARLDELVRGVLPGDGLPRFRSEVVPDGHVQISTSPLPIRRSSEADAFAVLSVRYNCIWSRGVLAVRGSAFMLRTPSAGGPPVLQVDYLRDPGRDMPASHFNVSSQHPGLLHMVDPEDVAQSEHGRNRQTHRLHLPTGGHRFRPALEDVLHMLIREFGIARRDSWRQTILRHRQAYREIQTMAAVRDHPASAVEELTRMGYDIQWAGDGSEPTKRRERLEAF